MLGYRNVFIRDDPTILHFTSLCTSSLCHAPLAFLLFHLLTVFSVTFLSPTIIFSCFSPSNLSIVLLLSYLPVSLTFLSFSSSSHLPSSLPPSSSPAKPPILPLFSQFYESLQETFVFLSFPFHHPLYPSFSPPFLVPLSLLLFLPLSSSPFLPPPPSFPSSSPCQYLQPPLSLFITSQLNVPISHIQHRHRAQTL